MGGGADHGHGHGGEHGDFRSKVWSMSGGPNCRPKHWKRNTAFAMVGVILVCIPLAMTSAKLEVFILFLIGLIHVYLVWSLQESKPTDEIGSVDLLVDLVVD